MLRKSVISQIKYLLGRKEALFTFYVLLAMVLYNFVRNVMTFQGMDIVEMYHPMKLISLSYNLTDFNGSITFLLIQLYPILVVFPAGFSLAKEYQSGEYVYASARLGVRKYKLCKIVSAFFTTMIVFVVPFLLELILNCFSFPLSGEGDLSNWGYYDAGYIERVKHYLMSSLFIENPYVCALLGILIFGIVSGILGAFVVIISSVVRVKYRVFLFVPTLLLLNATIIFTEEHSVSKRWYDYLLLFNEEEKNVLIFAGEILVLLLISAIVMWIGNRRERI